MILKNLAENIKGAKVDNSDEFDSRLGSKESLSIGESSILNSMYNK